MASVDRNTDRHKVVAVFGATGTAGDGVLKAVMNESTVDEVQVFTRRTSPRIDTGVQSGLVRMIIHMDYLDYAPIRDELAETDTVYWALGTSTTNVTKDEYSAIHVDFPVAFVKEWLDARSERELSFHLVSGGGASESSMMHWAREKARVEQALFELGENSRLRVISYRPAYIVPTEEQSNFAHTLAHTVFEPVKLAIRATTIGEAMLEVSARGEQLPNGTILENREIIKYSNGYRSE